MIAIDQAELDAAERERQRIVNEDYRQRRRYPKNRVRTADYERWCYCSWCPHSAASTPHYRRAGQCPDPSAYRAA